MLDLRSATADNEKKKLVWKSLLGSKYQKNKPEIRTTLSTESDKVRASEPTQQEIIEKTEQLDVSHLDVVLDDERGYYLIGPESDLCEVYKLSIAIGGARNLTTLLPSGDFHLLSFYFVSGGKHVCLVIIVTFQNQTSSLRSWVSSLKI